MLSRQLSRVLCISSKVVNARSISFSPRCHIDKSYGDSMLEEISEKFLGSRKVNYTHQLTFLSSKDDDAIPIFSMVDRMGHFFDDSLDPKVSDETLLKMYHDMVVLSVADKILYESQRQGRISFYMTNTGEEALQIGSAAAFEKSDLIFAQYRETGVLMYRGFTLQNIMDQCYSNVDDLGKGRQMPAHYGSKDLNFVTISSPLGTQMPQAVGAAYAYKRAGRADVVACYFGEGTTSVGDAHAAFRFAATLQCPIVLVCRNNGYAISTPAAEQYSGDGVAGHAYSYGLHVVRVDGNDALAVYAACRAARKMALEGKPVLIEAMTYRLGHHSTSDDSTAYRTLDEVQFWQTPDNSPVARFKLHLITRNLWNEEKDEKLKAESKHQVLDTFGKAEKKKKPNIDEMFKDVYCEMTPRLKEQAAELKKHLAKYGKHYPLENYDSK